MERYNKIKSIVADMDSDVKKFIDKGNSAAGTRIRKALQEIKILSLELRKEVSELKVKPE